jgi:hypothetical protein
MRTALAAVALACSVAAAGPAAAQTPPPSAAPKQSPASPEGKMRGELVQLYLASIAADRCEFPITEPDADALIQAALGLQKKLKLNDEAADALYEEVETAFESKLPDACKKDGEIAKSFAEVMARITKR